MAETPKRCRQTDLDLLFSWSEFSPWQLALRVRFSNFLLNRFRFGIGEISFLSRFFVPSVDSADVNRVKRATLEELQKRRVEKLRAYLPLSNEKMRTYLKYRNCGLGRWKRSAQLQRSQAEHIRRKRWVLDYNDIKEMERSGSFSSQHARRAQIIGISYWLLA